CKNINKNITIYNLLTHSSGLIDIGSAEALKSTAKLDYNSQIENLAKEALLFEPGTKCLYTNSNFFILSLLVEYYSGETLENYLLKKVCAPLGMNTVEIETNHKIIDNLAVGYEMVDGKIVPGGFVNMDLMFGAGYSVGKIDDVYKLSLAVRERKLLKRETWDMILTPCSVGEYGLGCNVYKYNESPCCHHSGGYTGFRNLHRYFFEKDFAIGFLSNCGFGSARADVSKEIYERYFNLVDNMTYVEMDKGFV
ncbi:MAG: beta-lactamase family protein, partial [Clostridia bacterium]|nr:beta-lactamase family protein [Clostridia bacterium]